jgi:hypothetical protein
MRARGARVRRNGCLAAALALLSLACGSKPGTEELEPNQKVRGGEYRLERPLRFSGVDLLYALRRVAAETKLGLVIDEVRTQTGEGADLGLTFVDLDLEPAPVQDVLERLREASGKGFDFRVLDGVLVLRSTRSMSKPTDIDLPNLPHTQVEADLIGFARWIQQSNPNTYVQVETTRGEPVFRRVDVEIPQNSSVLQAITIFARAVERPIRLMRGGREYDGEEVPNAEATVVATTVAMMPPLDGPQPVQPRRMRSSLIWGIAGLEKRNGAIVTVVDRTLLGDQRGSLDFAFGYELPGTTAEVLDVLKNREDGPDTFRWEEKDGVYRVHTRAFDYFLTGRDTLDDVVRPGTFEGTLQDLARWLEQQRMNPTGKKIWAGEYLPDAKSARIEVAEGATVEEVLNQFAKAAGEGWFFVARGGYTPDEEVNVAWGGAYLTSLKEWGPDARTPAIN